MNPYSKDTPCAKCGTGGAMVEYCLNTADATESMRRTCGRCGFFWYEAPLDAAPPLPFAGNHIESKDPQAICLCGEKVVEWIPAGTVLPAVYRCPKAIPDRKAG